MRLAVCDYAHRPFEDVVDTLARDGDAALRTADAAAGVALDCQTGPVRVVSPTLAAIHASWRRPDGSLWFDGELRVLAVNRGSDAVTELLLVGESAKATGPVGVLPDWGHRLLAALSGIVGGRGRAPTAGTARG